MVGYNCFIIFQYYYLNIKILKFYENWNYKFIFRNIHAIHDLTMCLFTKISTNFKKFIKSILTSQTFPLMWHWEVHSHISCFSFDVTLRGPFSHLMLFLWCDIERSILRSEMRWEVYFEQNLYNIILSFLYIIWKRWLAENGSHNVL
jgi:hypothetical protein